MLLNGLVFVVWRSSWLQSCDCGCPLCMKGMIVTQRGSLANVVSCFKDLQKSFFFFSYYLNHIHNGWWLGCGMGMHKRQRECVRISERYGDVYKHQGCRGDAFIIKGSRLQSLGVQDGC